MNYRFVQPEVTPIFSHVYTPDIAGSEHVYMEHVHRLPGRLRVRCGSLKRNPGKAVELSTTISALPGVESVTTNTLTGSVLVHYDPAAIACSEILAAVQACGIHVRPAPRPSSQPADVSRTLGGVIVRSLLEHAVQRSIARVLPMLI